MGHSSRGMDVDCARKCIADGSRLVGATGAACLAFSTCSTAITTTAATTPSSTTAFLLLLWHKPSFQFGHAVALGPCLTWRLRARG